jgi:hypothetical protein
MTTSSEPSLVLYGEPVPADLRAITESVLPPDFTLRVVGSKARDELLEQVPSADFLLVATVRVARGEAPLHEVRT